MGGILKPLSPINEGVDADKIQYDFVDGVRDLLLDAVPLTELTEVLRKVSEYVVQRAGLSVDEFTAMLVNPGLAVDDSSGALLRPFAQVTAKVLRRLGGKYAEFADSIVSNVSVKKVKTINSHLLWQKDKTKVYSVCVDKPWNLSFDALVIPFNPSVSILGSLARSFENDLKQNFIIASIEKAKKEKNTNVITSDEPLLVALPSKISSQLFPLEVDNTERFVICVTIEDSYPKIKNVYKAVQSVIVMAEKQKFSRIVIPLLGTGDIGLNVNDVALKVLRGISESLKQLPSNTLE